MKILRKRIIRSIFANIKTYIAIIIISMLSVMLYTGLSANYHNIKTDVYKTMEASNMADTYVTVTKCNATEENNFKYDTYPNNTYCEEGFGVEAIEKRLYIDAYVNERKIYVATYNERSTMNVPAKILDGELGVCITKSFSDRRNIKIGDKIDVSVKVKLLDVVGISQDTIDTYSSYLRPGAIDLFGIRQEISIPLTVTGIMQHGEALGNLASDVGLLYVEETKLKSGILSVIDTRYNLPIDMFSTLKFLLNTISITNQYLIKGGNTNTLRKYFTLKENNNLLIITTKDMMPGTYAALTDVSQSEKLCYVFPIVFYIASVLIVIASIDKAIADDHKALGLLNALGESKIKIYTYYSLISIIQVLIGGILGLILGPIIIPSIIGVKYERMYSTIHFRHQFIHINYIWCFFLLVLVCLITTLIQCFKYLRMSPKDAMQNSSIKERRHLTFNKILPKKAFALKMALRNIFWNPVKSLLVIIGVLGCSTLLICGFGIEDTLDYGLHLELDNRLDYDIEVSYNHNMLNGDQIKARDSRIVYTEEYSYSLVTLEYGTNMVDTILNVVKEDSKCVNIPLSNDGATISEKLANSLGVKVGDEIGIYTAGSMHYVNIANITSMFFSQGIYLNTAYNVLPYENNRCMVLCEDNTNLDEVCDAIKIDPDYTSTQNGIYYTKTKAARYASANGNLEALRIVTGMITTFAILLCIAVIYNLVSLNFKERERDMASLKSLGYGYKENARALTYEISILTITGTFFGMLLGKPFLKMILALQEPPLISFSYHIDVWSFILALILTVGVSAVLNLLISIRIKDIDMVEALKGRE